MRLTFESARKIKLDEPYVFNLRHRSVRLEHIQREFFSLQRYQMTASGFGTEQEANNYGLSLRKALILSASVEAIPLDWGFDRARGGLAPRARKIQEDIVGVPVINDVHGLSVYPTCAQIVIMSGRATTPPREPKTFSEPLFKYFGAEGEIDEDLQVALELYHDAGLQTSSLAKLILSLSVIERLSNTNVERNSIEVEFLERCLDDLKHSELPSISKNSLEADLKRQQKMSKKKAGRQFVNEHCPEEEKLFCELYDYRGRVAHPSSRKSREDVSIKASEAWNMVGKLLRQVISKKFKV